MFPWIRCCFLGPLVLQVVAALSVAGRAAPPAGYRLAWADEFDGAALDTNKWDNWNSGPYRDARNTPEAVTVEDGHLTIRTYTVDGTHYTGMVSTWNTLFPLHGYFEARIDFEGAPGMWSAFWVLSPSVGSPLGDPGAAGTEIDVCQYRKTDDAGSALEGRVYQALHWDGYGSSHKIRDNLSDDLDLGSGFHTYGLEWTETGYRYYIDERPVWSVEEGISNRTQFILLSNEVEDDSWAGNVPQMGYGDLAATRVKMRVDYVRYYAPPSQAPPPPPPPATRVLRRGSTWKYLASPGGAPEGWALPGFDDGAWPAGRAEFGYGDGDEATVVPFGTDPVHKWITTYFRSSFTVSDPTPVQNLFLRLRRDDGAVVYINGVEALRSNMPQGPFTSETLAETIAVGPNEGAWFGSALDRSLIAPGDNVIAVEVHQVRPESSDLSFDLSLELQDVYIEAGSRWKFLTGPVPPQGAWRAPDHDDTAWPDGDAEFGYGDGDETTSLPFGGDPDHRWVTAYFRSDFEAVAPGSLEALVLRLKCDDGAVVYINGVEAHRENMPAGAIGHDTPAAAVVEGGGELAWRETTLDAGLLHPGRNVVAVEVHQVSPSSPDLTFDLSLAGLVPKGAGPPEVLFVRGDSNDDGTVDISDASHTLNWLFRGAPTPGCIAALNTNGDPSVDISDPIYLLTYLFLGGPGLPPPYPSCGIGVVAADETLGCKTPPAHCR